MTTWNKFCFTGGLIEASVVLPGTHNVAGFWPAIWTMGNLGLHPSRLDPVMLNAIQLGRAGFGASVEGLVSILEFVIWTLLMCDCYHFRSGPIHTIRATSVHCRTKRMMDCRWLPP
jgi:hypothetical protein